MFAGGVIAEDNGSMTVEDRGWMLVRKGDEPGHHAPPPLRVETVDLPIERTTSLLAKSLDGAWVEFGDLIIETAEPINPPQDGSKDLPKVVITFSDKSGGRSSAWLYQPTGRKLRLGQRVAMLRGFMHAEQPGVYVLLSDKEEDIAL